MLNLFFLASVATPTFVKFGDGECRMGACPCIPWYSEDRNGSGGSTAARRSCENYDTCIGYSIEDSAAETYGRYTLYFSEEPTGRSANTCNANKITFSSRQCEPYFECWVKESHLDVAQNDVPYTKLGGGNCKSLNALGEKNCDCHAYTGDAFNDNDGGYVAAKAACDSYVDCVAYSHFDTATEISGRYELFFKNKKVGTSRECRVSVVDYSDERCEPEYDCYVKDSHLLAQARVNGDPHMMTLDGLHFDVDTPGIYELITVPKDGSRLKAKTEVGEAAVSERAKEENTAHQAYQLKLELTGSAVNSQNVTVVGRKAEPFGVVIDGVFTSFEQLTEASLQVGETVLSAETCEFRSETYHKWSKFCKGIAGNKPTSLHGKTQKFIQADMAELNAVVKHKGTYIDVFFNVKDSKAEIAGLLASKGTVRKSGPLLASSTDGEDAESVVTA